MNERIFVNPEVPNTAARIVTKERKFCNITPILKDLHWLYLFLLVLISKLFYRSTSVYMELPRNISLPNFRSMHAPSPT